MQYDPLPIKLVPLNALSVWEKGHVASQCPNKRTMILLENGEVDNESSKSSHSSSS